MSKNLAEEADKLICWIAQRIASNEANVFCFSVVFTPPPSTHHGSVWLLPVSSLFLTNTVSQVRVCLSIWLERFRESQKVWTSVGLSVFNSSMVTTVCQCQHSQTNTVHCSTCLFLYCFLWNFFCKLPSLKTFTDFGKIEHLPKDSCYANNIFIAELKWSNLFNPN